jgi:hypothetical protein
MNGSHLKAKPLLSGNADTDNMFCCRFESCRIPPIMEDDIAAGAVPALKAVSTLTGMGFDSSVFRHYGPIA